MGSFKDHLDPKDIEHESIMFSIIERVSPMGHMVVHELSDVILHACEDNEDDAQALRRLLYAAFFRYEQLVNEIAQQLVESKDSNVIEVMKSMNRFVEEKFKSRKEEMN